MFICYTVPAPIYPFVIRESRSGVLYEGTTFSWICVITPNTTGVDTDFTISSTVVGPRTPDMGRIIISPPVEIDNVYETNITFRALRLDDNGTYNCSASATSSLRYVSASELTTEIEMIAVTGKITHFICSNFKSFHFPSSITSPSGEHYSYPKPNSWSSLHSGLLCQDRGLCHQCS